MNITTKLIHFFIITFLYLANLLSNPNQIDLSCEIVSDELIEKTLQNQSLEELTIAQREENKWNVELHVKLFSGTFPKLKKMILRNLTYEIGSFLENKDFAKNLNYLFLDNIYMFNQRLDNLENFEKLTHLTISNSNLSATSFKCILPNLIELNLIKNFKLIPLGSSHPLSSEDLSYIPILQIAPNLQKLCVQNLKFNYKDPFTFPMNTLFSLDLSLITFSNHYFGEITQNHFTSISQNCPSLTDLDMSKRILLGDFTPFTNLENLNLSSSQLHPATFESLKNLTQLKKLNISHLHNNYFSNEDILALKNALPKCEIIGIEQNSTTHLDFSGKTYADMHDILYMMELESLDMSHVVWSKESINFFKKGKFSNLKELNLSFQETCETATPSGATFPWNISYPLEDFSSFAENLEVLFMQGIDFKPFAVIPIYSQPGTDLAALANLKSLRILNLAKSSLGQENIDQISMTSLDHLEELILDYTNIRTAAFETFTPNLKTLSLKGSNIIASDILRIAKIKTLEKLDLSSTSTTTGFLKKLGIHPNLKELFIAHTDMKKADFKYLQNIEKLDLSYCELTLSSALTLFNLKNLKELNMRNNYGKLPENFMKELQEALPDCNILN